MLAQRWRATTKLPRRLRQIDRRGRHRRGSGEARIVHIVEKAGRPNVLVFQRLLRRIQRRGRNGHALQLGQRLGGGARAGPLVHAGRNLFAMLGPRFVALKPRVAQPVRFAHQTRPALEHGIAQGIRHHPSVRSAEHIGRRPHITAIQRGDAIGLRHLLFHQRRVMESERGA